MIDKAKGITDSHSLTNNNCLKKKLIHHLCKISRGRSRRRRRF